MATLAGAALLARGVRGLEASRAQCPGTAGKVARWIVPYSPGGGYDIYARLIEPFLEAKLGAEIVVDNMPGAAGMVGARALQQAAPDGLTLGILNAPGLLTATLSNPSLSLNPAEDFTILGRVARNQTIWATGARSGLRTIEDVLSVARTRPIIVGITEVASNNFVSLAVGAYLLGIRVEYVPGFAGSRESSLALLRGDIDLSSYTFGSVLDHIDNGDLRPLLQITHRRIAPHGSLENVPLLAGDDGLAARRAGELQREESEAAATADALTGFVEAGRVIAAPPSLRGGLLRCLDQRLHEVMTDPEFEAAAARANRTLDVAAAAAATEEIRAAAAAAPRLLRIVEEPIRRIRG